MCPFNPWPVLPGDCQKCLSCPQLPREYSIVTAGPGALNFRAQGGVASSVHTCSHGPDFPLPLTLLPVSSLLVSSPGISERGPWMQTASWGSDPMLPLLGHDAPRSPRCSGTDCTQAVLTQADSPRTLHVPWSQQMSGGFEGPTLKRRGGVVDHRDVILAHQAHKMHCTPQARRKEWE